jgi:hypothetical protein
MPTEIPKCLPPAGTEEQPLATSLTESGWSKSSMFVGCGPHFAHRRHYRVWTFVTIIWLLSRSAPNLGTENAETKAARSCDRLGVS